MTADLFSSNQLMLVSLMKAEQLSEASNESGLTNFLQDRIMAHKKLAWKLRSTLNKAGE
jgi:DNA-binding ferritin-like protein